MGVATASFRHALPIGLTDSALALSAICLRFRVRDLLKACNAFDFMFHHGIDWYNLLVVAEAFEVFLDKFAATLLTRLLKSQSP